MPFSRRQLLGAGLTPLFLSPVAVGVLERGLLRPAWAQDDDDEEQPVLFFRIGTGSTAGTYYPVGAMLAAAISNPPGGRTCPEDDPCGVPGMVAVAQSTQGSVDNVRLMQSGSLDSGFCQADIAYWATAGEGLFAEGGRIEGLRVIASLFPELLHVVVRRDADIDSLRDLRGKRVSLDLKGSGTRVDALLLFEALKLDPASVDLVDLSPPQAAEALRLGELDALFLMAGAPVSTVESLARTNLVDLLPVDGEAAEALVQRYPFFTVDAVPPGTYPNIGVTPTLSVAALWLVKESVPAEVVYGITRTLWSPSTRALLDGGHPRAREIRLETALKGIGQPPLHEGALRYYREIGLPGL